MRAAFVRKSLAGAALARAAGEHAVEERVGKHAQGLGDDAHLPWNDAVADASLDGSW